MKHFCLAATLFSVAAVPARADATLVFNEIMYHPATNEPAMEWVELYNQLAVDLDVSGWRISGDIGFTFGANTRVRGRSYIVVAINPAALIAATGVTNVLGPFTNRLSNSGGTLHLRNNNDRLVDEVSYGTEGDWPVGPDGSGVSLAKRDRDAGSALAANWTASRQVGGTPGVDNGLSNAPAALAFNELSASTNAAFWLELGNPGTSGLDLSGMVIRYDGATNSDYIIPAGTTLGPGRFLTFSNDSLGFLPLSGDRLYLYASDRLSVLDGVVVKKGPRARSPDGTGTWLIPNIATPDASNSLALRTEIVINEIMYQHKPFPGTNGLPAQANPEEWIELFNRGSNAVDLTGWELDGGISYAFPAGKTLAPGAYLVVAREAASLRTAYPAMDIVGDFSGRLSSDGDELVLRDAFGNPADAVHYHAWGRWPEYPAGGGSSLELRDPKADNAKAEAWAASDESGKSAWQTVSYRMVVQASLTPNPDSVWREFALGLLAAGECLIDDIRVVQSPSGTPVQMLDNGDFENGLTGWRVLGTHGSSRVIADPDNPGNKVLHVIATGPQEHMHNHIETTLADNRSVVDGQLYEISYRARWRAGNSLLNTRLWFNRVARTTELSVPQRNGSPGARNSRHEANIGPTFAQFQHQPVVPAANASVTVSVQAQDPHTVTNCQVFWSANGGAFSAAPMTFQAGGAYAGTIPGYAAGTTVQFYVRAVDGLGAASTFPARAADGGALYKVNDAQANVALAHNLRIVTTPANAALLHADTNVMSNDNLPCTVIYDERIAHYDVGLRLKASMNGRPHSARVGFHLAFQPDDLFRGVHPAMGMDRRPGDNLPRNEEIVVRHAALAAGGIPTMQMDICRVLAPRSTENGPAILTPSYEDEFLSTSFENGEEGALFEMEGIYYSRTANAAGYKLPQPNTTTYPDLGNHGDDKETYRYYYILKNHRNADDYSQFIAFAKPFSLSGAALETQTRQMMDLDQWLRAYALITLFGVNDTYTFWLNHNLMIYFRPSDHKAVYLMWDNDFAFARSATDAIVGGQNLGKIINLPSNLRVLYAQLLDLIETTYNTAYMGYWLAHYGPFSGADYTPRTSYIQQRTDYVRNVIAGAGGNTPFTVNATNLTVTGSNLVTLSGTAPVRVKTMTINGVAWPVTWTTLTSWTVRLPLNEATNQLQIVGTDLRGNIVTNATIPATVVINAVVDAPEEKIIFTEIMFQPTVPGAEFVELFNTSSNTTFDLSGWRVNGLDYAFPTGSYFAPRSQLVLARNRSVFAATYGNQIPLFDEFGGDLQLDGETLTLIKPGATPSEDLTVDRVRYEPVRPWPVGSNEVTTASSIQLVDASQDNGRPLNWSTRYSPAVWSEGIFTPAVTNEGWVFFSWSGAPGSTSGDLKLFMDSPGAVFLDDLAFVEGSEPGAGVNLLTNGGFETGNLDSWTVLGAATNSTVKVAAAYTGSHGLEFKTVGSAGSLARLQQRLNNLVSSNTYTLSFWYHTIPDANNLNFHLTSYYRSGGPERPPINLQRNIIPASYTPPQIITPAVLSYTPGAPNVRTAVLAPIPPLWLNEVQPSNLTGLTDIAGETEPWIELYNAGSNAVALTDCYLADDYTNLTQWAFPAGATIQPGEFKILFADGQPQQTTASEWHTSFRLNGATGSVALVRMTSQPEVLDYINYANVLPDASYGSFPDGQPFYRAELHYATPGGTNDASLPPARIYINEWMAANSTVLADPADGDFEDWFELYNPTTNVVDLAGWSLTDSLNNPSKYRITTNGPHLIPPRGYFLVWADEETGQNLAVSVPRPDLHVNFKLATTGEEIGLFGPDGRPIDAVTFGLQTNDVSMGRFPDGEANVVFMPGTASPRAANYLDSPDNTPPVLDPIGDKLIYTGQTLGFSATARDTDVPMQTLVFTLDPGAPLGAVITDAGAFTWTPNAPGNYSITIRVTDDGTPPRSAFETIAVEVLNLPALNGVMREGGHFKMSWETRAGQIYAVDYKNDLSAPLWIPLWTNTGLGNSLSFTNAFTNAPHRFFRIRAGLNPSSPQ